MAVNDTFVTEATGVADTNNAIFDGSGSGTGSVIGIELGGTGDADIYRETDPAGDGTFSVSVKIDKATGNWHTQLNDLIINGDGGARIKVTNTSGSSQDFYLVGKETDN
jgi:hypothetical protein